MVRVIEVVDGRTIVVIDEAGKHSTITMDGVAFGDAESAEAAAHLRRLVFGQWVLVEQGGFVYRSPDALFVNAEMSRRPWRGVPRFVYLGTVDPAPSRPPAKVSPSQKASKPSRSVPNLPRSQGGVAKKKSRRG